MTTEKEAISTSKAVSSKVAGAVTEKPKPAKRTPITRRTKIATTSVKRVAATARKTPIEPKIVIKEQPINGDEKAKTGKIKMERDSFTMPKDEYAQLDALKARLLALGQPAKKSELLRAGIKQLVAMTNLRLKKAMAEVPVIKTGRPKKKK